VESVLGSVDGLELFKSLLAHIVDPRPV